MNGNELIEKLNHYEDDLELPVVAEVHYFEKYPLIPTNLSLAGWNAGLALVLQCDILKDEYEGYSDLRAAKKQYDYIRRIYEDEIREHFKGYNQHVNEIQLELRESYRDSLMLRTWNGFPPEAILSFTTQFGYNMPTVKIEEEDQTGAWYYYTFYKKNMTVK